MRAYKKGGDKPFSRACFKRMQRNGFELRGSFSLDIRKKNFTVRVVNHGNRLSRGVVKAPSLRTSLSTGWMEL